MWLTPILTAAALVLGALMVADINTVIPRASGIPGSHAAAASTITEVRRGFEKEHHLVVAPALGTPVVLIADSPYMREYHGAVAGSVGSVVMHSQLGRRDAVLVNWGSSPQEMVQMALDELRLAPANQSPVYAGKRTLHDLAAT